MFSRGGYFDESHEFGMSMESMDTMDAMDVRESFESLESRNGSVWKSHSEM